LDHVLFLHFPETQGLFPPPPTELLTLSTASRTLSLVWDKKIKMRTSQSETHFTTHQQKLKQTYNQAINKRAIAVAVLAVDSPLI
jgi:hypothetical protein